MDRKGDDVFPAMEKMTVKTVRDYLQRKQSIIIPVGSIEQHGYHLPLSTDALLATRLSYMIGEETDILVGPTVHHSFSGGGCPGTINISPAVMSLLISDMLSSLVSQGFRSFYLFLGHGGSENLIALQEAMKVLLRTNPSFEKVMLVLMPCWECDAWKKGFSEGDWHAGWMETSLMMAVAPELVHIDQLELDKEPYRQMQIEDPDNYQLAEKIVDDSMVVARITQNPEIKVGVMGYPERASAQIGKQMIKSIVDFSVKKISEFESKADGVYKVVERKSK